MLLISSRLLTMRYLMISVETCLNAISWNGNVTSNMELSLVAGYCLICKLRMQGNFWRSSAKSSHVILLLFWEKTYWTLKMLYRKRRWQFKTCSIAQTNQKMHKDVREEEEESFQKSSKNGILWQTWCDKSWTLCQPIG